MKNILPIIAILLLSVIPSFSFADEFNQAQAAYDEGHYAESATLYGGLASNGVNNIELHYNLANALFKNENLPEAVWNYRKAWYDAPRDPDIRANLHFALNATGAVVPAPSFMEHHFNRLSQTEWIRVAIGGYLFFTLLLILGLLLRSAKRTLTQLSLLPAALILVAIGGWWHWQRLAIAPEGVVMKSGATALFGPVEGSTTHYKIPLGALIQQKNADAKGWVEIEYDGKLGWIKQEYIQRLYP